MPRRAPLLTDRQVRALHAPGLHAVGGMVPGLALQVTQTPGNPPARSWVLRATVAGRRRAMGLGPYPAVTLGQARQKAEALWRDIRDQRDPVRERRNYARRASPAAASPTFESAASDYIDERRPSWKNAKHAAQWEATLRTYAYPVIGAVPVAEVDRAMVLKVVKPIWNDKTETAERVKDRIKLVLSWAKAHGMRDGEVRGATWDEMDLDAAVWTLPAERMKAGRPHRVPLSPAALTILKRLPRVEGTDAVFPGRSAEGKLSENTLNEVIT